MVEYSQNRESAHGSFTKVLVAGSVATGCISLLTQVITGASYPVIVASLALIILPQTFLVLLSEGDENDWLLLGTLITSAMTVFYLFAFQFPELVGTDAPSHYSRVATLLEEHHYDLREARGASFEYPHLYYLFAILQVVSATDLNSLTVWLAPAINVVAILFLYLLARSLLGRKIGYLTALLYTFEYFTFYFGFEFRTQPYSMLFLLGLLHLLLSGRQQQLASTTAILLLMASLVTSHLVTATQGVVLLLLLSFSAVLLRVWKRPKNQRLFGTTSVLALVLLLAYMSQMAPTLESTLPYVTGRLTEVFSGVYALSGNLQGLAVAGYLPIVAIVQWTTRLLFVGAFIWFSISSLKRPTLGKLFIALSTVYFGCLLLIDSVSTGFLSPGRWGMYFNIGYTMVLAWGLTHVTNFFNRVGERMTLAIFLGLAVTAYAIGNVSKLPTWLIGTTSGPTFEFSFDKEAMLASSRFESLLPQDTQLLVCGNSFADWVLRSAGLATVVDVHEPTLCSFTAYGSRLLQENTKDKPKSSKLYLSGDIELFGPQQ